MTLCPSQGPCMAMVQPLWGGHGTTAVVLQQDGCDFTGTASSGNLAIFVRGLYDCPTNPQFRMFLFTENLALAARSWSGLRRMPVQGLCSASYDMSTAKGLKIFHITPLGFRSQWIRAKVSLQSPTSAQRQNEKEIRAVYGLQGHIEGKWKWGITNRRLSDGLPFPLFRNP